jgi:hypothetical protein
VISLVLPVLPESARVCQSWQSLPLRAVLGRGCGSQARLLVFWGRVSLAERLGWTHRINSRTINLERRGQTAVFYAEVHGAVQISPPADCLAGMSGPGRCILGSAAYAYHSILRTHHAVHVLYLVRTVCWYVGIARTRLTDHAACCAKPPRPSFP